MVMTVGKVDGQGGGGEKRTKSKMGEEEIVSLSLWGSDTLGGGKQSVFCVVVAMKSLRACPLTAAYRIEPFWFFAHL